MLSTSLVIMIFVQSQGQEVRLMLATKQVAADIVYDSSTFFIEMHSIGNKSVICYSVKYPRFRGSLQFHVVAD
jgi:hypothetical protein